jgi:hypothetical protein
MQYRDSGAAARCTMKRGGIIINENGSSSVASRRWRHIDGLSVDPACEGQRRDSLNANIAPGE